MPALSSPPVEVVTAGEALALLLADGTTPLRQADRFVRGVAGSESNVAIGLARLGHRVAFCGRVGDDATGGWVRDALRAEGIDVAGLHTDPDRPTGLILRDRPLAQPITVGYHRSGSAASAMHPDDLDPDLVAKSRVVYLSGITVMLSPTAAAFVERLLEVASAAAVPVVFDPNVRLRLAPLDRWRAAMGALLGRVDTLLIGDSECAQLGLPDDARLLTGATRTVVVKQGAAGACAYDHDGATRVPARTVPLVDPIGAGDAFNAGWISARLRGRTVGAALTEAAAVASLVVATVGDTDGLPDAAGRDRITADRGADVDR